MNFPQIVNAEHFPQKIIWKPRDFFAILLIPLIFINGWFSSNLFSNPIDIALADSLFRGILFIAICFIYKHMLLDHWKYFNRSKWKSWAVVILGAVLLQVVISVTRSLLPTHPSSQSEQQSLDPTQIAFLSLFIISFGPLFTALIEDIVFKYTLLHKLFIPNSMFRVVVVLLNSVIFGLIHYHNFDGNLLATVSFMVAGLFLNVVYIWTKNIWHVLLIHFLNNAALSLGGLILLKLVTQLTN